MPLEKSEKIWMDGTLVDWDDARIHILTHSLHYGCGVFEGIRAYATAQGPAVFRLTDHIIRLFNSARIFMIDVPFTPDQLIAATKETVRVNGLSSCYIRPIVYLGYGEMGLNPLPCPVNVSIAVWPWGPYLGDEGHANGVRMKISSWQRHDPNAMPPAAKGTGMYLNSSMAKVEAIKAGYDEAILLSPQGYVSECTGENLFVVRDGHVITPPVSAGRARGHHPELGDDDRRVTWATRSRSATSCAATSTPPTRPSSRAPRPRWCRSARSTTARSVCPGRSPAASRSVLRHGSGRGRPVQGLVGTCHHLRHRRSVEIFDTTLRDGSQLEGISLTVDDKLRIAEQLDWLGVHYIEGGWPGANPKDDEFFRRASGELNLDTSRLVAFGSTRRKLGKVDSDDTLRHLVEAGTRAVCIVGKCWDYHVTEALETTLDEGVAMVADSVEYLRGTGLEVLFDAEHFFDGYNATPSSASRVLEAAAARGATTFVLCDTNGGSLPHDIERVVGEVVAYFGADVKVGIHMHDDAGCGVANALAGVRGGCDTRAGHDQRLRRTHRQLQPHDDHPQPHVEDGRAARSPRTGSSGSRLSPTTWPSS